LFEPTAIETLIELGQLELDGRTTVDHLEPHQSTAAWKWRKGERHPNRRNSEAEPEHISTPRGHDQATALDLDARSDFAEAEPAQPGTHGEAAGIEAEPGRQPGPALPSIERTLNDLGPDANDASTNARGPGGHQSHLSCLDRQASDGKATELDVTDRYLELTDSTCDHVCWGERDAHAQGASRHCTDGAVAYGTGHSTDVTDTDRDRRAHRDRRCTWRTRARRPLEM
jgi:hypothetical protein